MAGRRPVEEAFAARRPAVRLLVTPGRRAALERIVLHATTLRIPIVEVEGGTLTSIAGFDGHQGVALVVEPRRFATLDEVLARAIERGEPPFVLILDSLEDPQNLGTVLRSAEAAGVHGVLFPTERQAPLSPAAIKASAGATEHLLLCPVDDLPQALADLHIRGLRIVGSEAEAPLSARQSDLRGPLAMVVGSEGHGLTPAVRRRCDEMVRIPMRGSIGSLNAAVAGSILLFEALGQRDPEARPSAVGSGGLPELAPRGRRRSKPEPDDDEPVTLIPAKAAVTPDAPEAPAEAAVTPVGSEAASEPETAPGPDSAADLLEATVVARASKPARAVKAATAAKPAEASKPAKASKATRATKAAPASTPAKPAKPRKAKAQASPSVTMEGDDLLPGGPDPVEGADPVVEPAADVPAVSAGAARPKRRRTGSA